MTGRRSFALELLMALLFICALLSVIPTVLLTAKFASCANGLITVAFLKPNEWSYNPWSKDGLFISPGDARWLLLHSDFPYRPCPNGFTASGVPTVSWLGRALVGSDSADRAFGVELLNHLLARGEPINAKDTYGLTPLHEAVLSADKQYLDLLLAAGANPAIVADSPSKAAGLTPYEFCQRLEKRRPRERIQLCRSLEVSGSRLH